MASSSGSVLAGRKRKSASRDPDQLLSGAGVDSSSAVPFVVDLTGDSPAKGGSARRPAEAFSDEEILIEEDEVCFACFRRPRQRASKLSVPFNPPPPLAGTTAKVGAAVSPRHSLAIVLARDRDSRQPAQEAAPVVARELARATASRSNAGRRRRPLLL
jgi:hypothetical protein